MTDIEPGLAHAKRLQGKRHKGKHDKGTCIGRKRDGRDEMTRKEKPAPRKSTTTESHLREEEAKPLPTPLDTDSLTSTASSDRLCCSEFDSSISNLLYFAPEQSTFISHGLGIISHAQSGMILLNICDEEARLIIIDMVIRHAFDCSYLVDQLFAISADHLAIMNPDQALDYQRSAMELQTRALNALNHEAQIMTQERLERDLVARLLHSFLLSLHVAFLTFTRYRNSFDIFIQHFIESVYLHRGIRTLAGLNYRLAIESPLGSFIAMVHDAIVSEPSGTECTRLVEFINSSDAGFATVTGCRDAARKLQWAFDMHDTLRGEQRALTAVVYPALITEEYITALQKYRLEALVILAHYGILLHSCRHVWIFGDAGAFLIKLVAQRLGPSWHDALKWPLEVVASEPCPT
ncbi:hypothetical protein CDV31_012802 [Fusarium ambrosium]|uniref:Uncharacterized protein n=1 Tax=Fusarium ambrosium TaxID=131363 RepID=A0A428T7J6_9HYPO|nr:hypothetical protein CDV31_012802 [Fusarium ambrosium]